MRTGLLLAVVPFLAACAAAELAPTADATGGVAAIGEDLEAEPLVDPGAGPPPASLEVADVVVGDGEPASARSTVTLHYVGVTWGGGDFVSTWDRGAPVIRRVDTLIAGVRDGVTGMREGGRRRIVVPPELGYGDQPPKGVGPGATLVFVVDLLGVHGE